MIAALLSVLIALVVLGVLALFAAINQDDRRHARQVHALGVATPAHDQTRRWDFDEHGRPW